VTGSFGAAAVAVDSSESIGCGTSSGSTSSKKHQKFPHRRPLVADAFELFAPSSGGERSQFGEEFFEGAANVVLRCRFFEAAHLRVASRNDITASVPRPEYERNARLDAGSFATRKSANMGGPQEAHRRRGALERGCVWNRTQGSVS
jgi:hypothetical protein